MNGAAPWAESKKERGLVFEFTPLLRFQRGGHPADFISGAAPWAKGKKIGDVYAYSIDLYRERGIGRPADLISGAGKGTGEGAYI